MAHDLDDQPALLALDAFVEGLFIIVGEDRHLGAGKRRPDIDLGRDPMDGSAGHREAEAQGIADGVGAANSRNGTPVR